MRALLACGFFLPSGCTALHHDTDLITVDARGPNVPPTVIRTRGEFDDFLRHVRGEPGPTANDPYGFAERLEAARPDFDRQALVLVRHDASSDSAFGFDVSHRRGTLVCDIRTRRTGYNRSHTPHWFAVAVDQPGPERVEVRVDGERQPGGPVP